MNDSAFLPPSLLILSGIDGGHLHARPGREDGVSYTHALQVFLWSLLCHLPKAQCIGPQNEEVSAREILGAENCTGHVIGT